MTDGKGTSAMADSPVTWLGGSVPAHECCPICKGTRASGLLLVDSTYPEPRKLQLNRCESCGSAFYEGDDLVLGYQPVAPDAYWRHYVEIGAGIDSLLNYLLCVDIAKNASLLDVGCGFGFTVDFWTRVRKARAVGLESAFYGRVGSRLLGAEIHASYLSECETIAGEKFDIVFSSEVIEHVEDPAAFLAELRSVLTPDGVLILTTPSTSCLRRDAELGSFLGALSPAAHYFILSERALTSLLQRTGFRHIRVRDLGTRLVAAASDRPISRLKLNRLKTGDYAAYLQHLTLHEDRSVRGGGLFRLFKERINRGEIDAAEDVFQALNSHSVATYGFPLDGSMVEQALGQETWLSYMETLPPWLGPALYYAGLLHAHTGGEFRQGLALFEAASRILRHERDHWARFAPESCALLEHAEAHLRRAAAETASSGTKARDQPGRAVLNRWRAAAYRALRHISRLHK